MYDYCVHPISFYGKMIQCDSVTINLDTKYCWKHVNYTQCDIKNLSCRSFTTDEFLNFAFDEEVISVYE